MMLLPCKPNVCQECAVDHKPHEAHNKDSLYYQYKFYGEHGRWPTWADAIAHCEFTIRSFWKDELIKRGVWSEPPEEEQDPMADETSDCSVKPIALDVSLEKARALHRVWRALNDGDCPKCHTFHRASEIRQSFGRPVSMAEWNGQFVRESIRCPTCEFTITCEEIAEIEKMFAPAMDAATAIFEEWRAKRMGSTKD